MEKSALPPAYTDNASAPPAMGFVTSAVNTETVTVVVPPVSYGPYSQSATCPHCKQPITTRLETEASTKTHLIALLICMIGGWCCCCVPYCVDSCQNRNHYCPSCNAYLGTYQT